jgi:hypothetical protein
MYIYKTFEKLFLLFLYIYNLPCFFMGLSLNRLLKYWVVTFIVDKFMNFKTVDSRTIISQVQEF